MNLVDSEVAALALGVSVATLRRLVARGEITNHGTGRRIRVDLDELQTFSCRNVRTT